MKPRMFILLTAIPLTIAITGCSEELANKKAEQAKLLQQHISSIVSACTGTLSLSTQITGDFENPATTTISCSEMDKKSDFFHEMTEKDLEVINNNVKKLN